MGEGGKRIEAVWFTDTPGSVPGVSAELEVSLLAAGQMRLGHKSHQIQPLMQS